MSYRRLVERAFDKIRQAATGMPAVMIRQLDALAKMMVYTTTSDQRVVVREQADMILRSAEASVPEPGDLADVCAGYERVSLPVLGTPTAETGSRGLDVRASDLTTEPEIAT